MPGLCVSVCSVCKEPPNCLPKRLYHLAYPPATRESPCGSASSPMFGGAGVLSDPSSPGRRGRTTVPLSQGRGGLKGMWHVKPRADPPVPLCVGLLSQGSHLPQNPAPASSIGRGPEWIPVSILSAPSPQPDALWRELPLRSVCFLASTRLLGVLQALFPVNGT